MQDPFFFLQIFIIISSACITANGVNLDTAGYYNDLVVAIDDKTVQNVDIPEYVDHIKMGIQDFSDLLHHATLGKFSIRTASIVVPTQWDVNVDDVATVAQYETSTIRVSHTYELPYTFNPIPCGHAAESGWIQLPYDFFNEGDNGRYGRLGKSLLVLFARLRFGVWEEHGYPGDSRFPYWIANGSHWEVNVCANEPIEGVKRNANSDEECDSEDEDGLYPPPSDCRFFPERIQLATSSLMSYHHLPTFEAFCNSSTHNPTKPTPHNLYCQHQSVMEVIENGLDWQQVNETNTPGRVEIRVVRTSARPLFYALLDSGATEVAEDRLLTISSRLASFINTRQLRNTVAGVGKFPPEEDNADGLYDEIIPWTLIGNNAKEFTTTLDSTLTLNHTEPRNYPAALSKLLLETNERKHESGAAILIVKTGVEVEGELVPEADLLSLAWQANIRVFAIEAHSDSSEGSNALKRLSEKSGGQHLPVLQPSDLLEPLEQFITALTAALQQSSPPNYVLAMKEVITQGNSVGINVPSRITQFEILVSPLRGTMSSASLLRGEDGNYDDIEMQEIESWEGGRSFVHSSNDHSVNPIENPYWQTFSASCQSNDCSAILTIFVQVEDISQIPQDITLRVSTSAAKGNQVGLASLEALALQVGAPFVIYAKLEQDGFPIQSAPGLSITATIFDAARNNVRIVRLNDDGDTAPDTVANDGVFSGVYVPNSDGKYRIFVTAKYERLPEEEDGNRKHEMSSGTFSSSVGKLFPVDQKDMGCGSGSLGCWSTLPENEFVLHAEIKDPVEFVNSTQYIPTPTRITDLVATSLSNRQVRLEWSAPTVFVADGTGEAQADFYQLRQSDRIEDLLLDFDNSPGVPDTGFLYPDPPRLKQEIILSNLGDADIYIAFKTASTYSNVYKVSSMSVIATASFRLDVETTTTTSTTTVRPTRSSTLRPSTQSTTEEVTEDETSPIPSTTSERTTTRRSTTTTTVSPPTSTSSTTASTPSTPRRAVQHWYETTEGIITLSVFGAAATVLSIGTVSFVWFTKYR